jgi:hypothetical protein
MASHFLRVRRLNIFGTVGSMRLRPARSGANRDQGAGMNQIARSA